VSMRVYEFAKQYGLSTKKALELLHEGGFEIGSHMSVLDAAAIDFLEKKIVTSSPSPITKRTDSPVAEKQNKCIAVVKNSEKLMFRQNRHQINLIQINRTQELAPPAALQPKSPNQQAWLRGP